MIPVLESIAISLKTTNILLPLLLSDVTEKTARQRIRDGKGPSIAWEVGHLLEYRCELLKLLGVDRTRPFAIDFTGPGATDGLDYPTIAALREAWEHLQTEVASALESASEESVRRRASVAGSPVELPALDSIAGFVWHEAYHIGAVVALRKTLGLPGMKELAMARAQAEGPP